MDLDERARRAASAVRASVEPLEPGLGDAVPEGRARWGMAVVAVVAVVAVGVGVGAAVLDDDDATEVVTGVADAPRLVPGAVPAELSLAAAEELPLPSDVPAVRLQLYGDPGADDPFAQGDLALGVARSGGSDVDPTQEGDPTVRVRGRDGLLYDAEEPAGVTILEWVETTAATELTITVASRSLGDGALVEVAEGLEVAGTSVRPRRLPGDLELVADQDRASVPVLDPVPLPPDARGWLVSYTTPDGIEDDQRALVVATHAGDDDHLDVLRWWFDGAPAQVRGHPGVAAADDDVAVLSWLEADGVAVTLSGIGIGQDALRVAAGSLEAVGAAEWDRLRVRAARGGSDGEILADGPLDEGTWRLTLEDDALCFETTSGTTSHADCTPIETTEEFSPLRWFEASDSEPPYVYGQTDADRVAVVEAADNEVEARVVTGPGGRRFFVVERPPGATEVVALDADGAELARQPLGTSTPGRAGATTTVSEGR
jgi:hypothetical protein